MISATFKTTTGSDVTVTIDNESAGQVYVKFSDVKVAHTERLTDHVMLDRDTDGSVIGIEII